MASVYLKLRRIIFSMGSRLCGNDGFEANILDTVIPAEAGTHAEH
jgi:hypothetical protein